MDLEHDGQPEERPIAQIISELRDMQSEIRDYGKLPSDDEPSADALEDVSATGATAKKRVAESSISGAASQGQEVCSAAASETIGALSGSVEALAKRCDAQQARLEKQGGELDRLQWQVGRMRQGFLHRFIRDAHRASMGPVFRAWAKVRRDREAAEAKAALKDEKILARQARLLRQWSRRALAGAWREWQTGVERRRRALRQVRRAGQAMRHRALLRCWEAYADLGRHRPPD